MTADNRAPKGGHPEKIGRYHVIERIGHGAMGLVYRARDEAMGREVAIKLLVTDLEDEPEVRTRFLREAESAARLSQPNIITIFDVGEDRGRFFIVMELLRGATLKEFLAQAEAPSLDRKLDLMIQLCAGLAAAHNEGIYHRDIKPGNLFVRTDGILKILDFGVARLSSSNMTSAGLVVGTPDYMSPEQARGIAIDGRSDIFSAGGVFYFMVTGRKPFEASDLPTIFRKIQHEAPRALTEAEAPAELADVILKALEKDKTKRYQTCQELMADLIEIKRHRAGIPPIFAVPVPLRDAVTVVTTARPQPASTADTVRSGAHAVARSAPSAPTPTPTPPPVATPTDAELTTWTASREDDEVTSFPFADVSEPATGTTSTSQTERIAGPKLVVFRGDSVVREFALLGSAIKIGRDPQNGLVLDDGTGSVSPVHAEIRPDSGGYAIIDLDSAQGLWFNKQRIQSAGLRLGVPVTVGAFDIALEDDSGSLEASAQTAAAIVPYVPSVVPEARPAGGPSPSTPLAPPPPRQAVRPAQAKPSAGASSQRQLVWWAVAAVVVLAVAGIAFRALRSQPPQQQPPQPAAQIPISSPPPPAPVEKDVAAQQMAQELAAAREQMAKLDFAGAIRDHLQPLLDRDPQNVDAAALKTQADAAIARASATATAAKAPRPKDAASEIKLVAGISRQPNESAKEYSDRATRVQTRYARGKQELEQKKFAAAIESFQTVDREQPAYLDVRSLLADASNQRSAAYREAMDRGARAESAGQLMAAYEAYRAAEQYDTTLAAAEKAKAVRERMSSEAAALFEKAAGFEIVRRPGLAIPLYQQVVDSLPEGDELRGKALERLKVLKP